MTIGPGSFYTSLMPIFLVRGVAEALADDEGPGHPVANLLTEGRGMLGFTAADAVARIEEAIQRPGRRRDHQHEVAVAEDAGPLRARAQGAARRRASLPDHCELVGGEFWTGEIARHDRLRLAYAVWSVLSRRLLSTTEPDHAQRRDQRSRACFDAVTCVVFGGSSCSSRSSRVFVALRVASWRFVRCVRPSASPRAR